jgi:hypothetical protein
MVSSPDQTRCPDSDRLGALAKFLLAVGVIWLLIALLLPASHKARSGVGPVPGVRNLRQIGIALHTYLDEHKTFPSHPGGSESALYLLEPYLSASAFDGFPFGNPSADARWDHAARRIAHSDFVYANRKFDVSTPGSTIVVVEEPANSRDGRYVLHLDGRSEWVPGVPQPVNELFAAQDATP